MKKVKRTFRVLFNAMLSSAIFAFGLTSCERPALYGPPPEGYEEDGGVVCMYGVRPTKYQENRVADQSNAIEVVGEVPAETE